MGGFVPVQTDVGLFLVLAVQPKFAPAIFGSSSCDTVLDVLKGLVESIPYSSELLGLLLLEGRDRFGQVLGKVNLLMIGPAGETVFRR